MRNRKKLSIQQRKKDHLKIALSPQAQIGNAGFENYKFIHNALPEIDFDKIDLSAKFLGKKVSYPFFISCMTGGVTEGKIINRRLAAAAQKYGIAIGVGSQRAAIEHPKLEELFSTREIAPDIPLIANVGLVQLNYGFGVKEFQKCIDMIKADAIAIHINPIQEVIQPEGDRNFENLLPKLKKIIPRLSVPVIAKEVGFGLSFEVVKKLYKAGVRIFDTAGWGGTNWSFVEGKRQRGQAELGELFSNWGIPTAESIVQVNKFKEEVQDKNITIIGSGGIRNGIEIAKALCLGADLVGIAMPFAKAALESQESVEKLIERYALELKIAMFGVGAKNIKELKKVRLLKKSFNL